MVPKNSLHVPEGGLIKRFAMFYSEGFYLRLLNFFKNLEEIYSHRYAAIFLLAYFEEVYDWIKFLSPKRKLTKLNSRSGVNILDSINRFVFLTSLYLKNLK